MNIPRFVLAGMVVAAAAVGQESAASRPVGVELPVSPFTNKFAERGAIVVTIGRTNPPDAEGSGASNPQWAIEVGKRAFSFDRAGMADLTAQLTKLGKARPGKTASAPSERDLLIRADAGAPYSMPQKVFEAAAAAKIYRIWIAAVPERGAPAAAFDYWLPRHRGIANEDEMRVLLSWNQRLQKLERIFGKTVCPATPDGNDLLVRLLVTAREDWEARGQKNVPMAIDAGPSVPWQHIIDVFGAGKRANVMQLHLGRGRPLEK